MRKQDEYCILEYICRKYVRYANRESCIILENTAFTMQGQYVGDKSKHILDLPHGEQGWINDKPFVYHYGRGTTRGDDLKDLWIKTITQYLRA